ncbi:MAG: hypothetical protein WCD55_05170 [Bacteroidales bacterium]
MEETIEPGDKSVKNPSNLEQKTITEASIPIIGNENKVKNQETDDTKTHIDNPYRSPRKKIRTYLFEFLMLFLAVFCGFIADSWREKLSEHQREKTFINSIVEDIKSDTLQSNIVIERLKTMHNGIDSVLIALTSPDVINNSNYVYRLWTRNLGLEVFVSNDRTIQQLKSSGELRLIRNKAVSDSIMKYDQTLKKYYTQSNLMYNAITNTTYYSQLFDFISLNKNPEVPVPLTEQGKKSLNQAYSNLDLWNRGLIGLISWLEIVNEEGKRLVVFIQKEYHLE